MTEQERRDLLFHYLEMEPTIYFNAETYDVSPHFEEEGVLFYAVCTRQHRIGAKTFIPKNNWEQACRGLLMAFLYNCVLESLEEGIRKNY